MTENPEQQWFTAAQTRTATQGMMRMPAAEIPRITLFYAAVTVYENDNLY